MLLMGNQHVKMTFYSGTERTNFIFPAGFSSIFSNNSFFQSKCEQRLHITVFGECNVNDELWGQILFQGV